MLFEYVIIVAMAILMMILYGYVRALVSFLLGDKSGEVKSRLTLNPMKQLDPIGAILTVIFGVGFIKPMRNSVMNFNKRKESIVLIVILPGIILIGASAILFHIFIGTKLAIYFNIFCIVSTKFFIYNLIPIYPLDGEKLVTAVGSPNLKMKLTQYGDILKMVLLVVTFMGIANIPVNFFTNIILTVIL